MTVDEQDEFRVYKPGDPSNLYEDDQYKVLIGPITIVRFAGTAPLAPNCVVHQYLVRHVDGREEEVPVTRLWISEEEFLTRQRVKVPRSTAGWSGMAR